MLVSAPTDGWRTRISLNPLSIFLCSIFVSATAYGISFPLLSINLEASGVSGALIGLNAAMPALGWLLCSIWIKKLQLHIGLKRTLIVFLVVALISILGFTQFDEYWQWAILRLLFGGSMGMFYRTFEYWLNTASSDQVRGKTLGIYFVVFMLGIALGSAMQPTLGHIGSLPYLIVSALLFLTLLIIHFLLSDSAPFAKSEKQSLDWRAIAVIPVALVLALSYGLLEDIPAYLLSVYAIKVGFSTDIAAFTLTAAAIGNILIPIPIGWISDRVDRVHLVMLCIAIVIVLSAVIPGYTSDPLLFLVLIGLWAGLASSLYLLSLAIIGDKYKGAELVNANVLFTIFYAAGSLFGPLINGFALDKLESQGLFVSASCILILCLITISYWSFKKEKANGM